MSNAKRNQPIIPNGIADLKDLTRWVKVLQVHELSLFDRLFTGNTPKVAPKRNAFTDETRFTSVKEVIESTSDEEEKTSRLIKLVQRLEENITQIQQQAEAFERSEEENARIKHSIDTKFMAIFDACLLLKDARDYGLIRTDSEKELVQKLIEKYGKWVFDFSISVKLPKFEMSEDVDYSNVALFQQLAGKLAPSPIAHQILSFSLLDWQRRMFMKLKEGENVICCAPTSSGKTMIALGFIYAFLKYRPKSLLVYVAPNNVLAMEIAAVLNKYVPNLVSTLLDDKMERKQDERVVVCTPVGAFTHLFYREKIPKDSFLVVDEVHCIGNANGVNMEYCLRFFSSVQTLILSATMTQETITKLKDCIRNSLPTNEINETTRFMIPQFMIPKHYGEDVKFSSLNPVGSIESQDLQNPNLDIPMTPRDILSLFVKVSKVFQNNMPEYLHPIRFFFIHGCRKPSEVKKLCDLDLEEPESGEIKRLSLDDFAAWQKAIFDFLAFPCENLKKEHNLQNNWDESIQSVLDAYKMSLTDDSTCECTPQNAFKLVERLKADHMLQALFFFPSAHRAFKYATFIYTELAKKPCSPKAEKSDKENQNKLDILSKQLESLEKLKLKKGSDAKDLKERKYQLQDMINSLRGTGSNVQSEHCLAENIISSDDFDSLMKLLKNWNSNITVSSPLAQMVVFGIGVLSGDMPYDLQVFIRKLYATNVIAVLMVTEDCAYGINTPTKTVVLSDGFTESQRRQMAGRAGRKGLSTNAWVIYFRLKNPEEAGQKLTNLRGRKLLVYTSNKLPKEESWITEICREVHPYQITPVLMDKIQSFYGSSRTIFGHSSIMGPLILEAVIKGTVGQTNRHISCILSVIPSTPFNRPYSLKEGWAYEFPKEVKKIYLENGFGEIIPNYTAYLWMTNQVSDISVDEIEELVEVSKYWSHLFLLLRNFFPENETNLYQQIMDLLTVSNIRSSTSI